MNLMRSRLFIPRALSRVNFGQIERRCDKLSHPKFDTVHRAGLFDILINQRPASRACGGVDSRDQLIELTAEPAISSDDFHPFDPFAQGRIETRAIIRSTEITPSWPRSHSRTFPRVPATTTIVPRFTPAGNHWKRDEDEGNVPRERGNRPRLMDVREFGAAISVRRR